jgi:hypothetical protein
VLDLKPKAKQIQIELMMMMRGVEQKIYQDCTKMERKRELLLVSGEYENRGKEDSSKK